MSDPVAPKDVPVYGTPTRRLVEDEQVISVTHRPMVAPHPTSPPAVTTPRLGLWARVTGWLGRFRA